MKRSIQCLFVGMLLFSSSEGLALEWIQDWMFLVGDNGDGIAAVGDDQEMLGFRCFSETKKCIHFIITGTSCNIGSEVPILVNTKSGASQISGMCGKSNKYELYLTPYDNIHTLLKKNSQIGFAIPLESGRFKALRFSLKGSSKAMDKAEAQVALQKKSPVSSETF